MKALFLRQTGAGYLLCALLLASGALLWVEAAHKAWLTSPRSALASLLSPVYFIAEIPHQTNSWVTQTFATRERLQAENASLEQRVLELSHVSQRYLALFEENQRLRALLGSRTRAGSDALVAEIVGVLPAADRHEVIIDKGSSVGVTPGLAVIDEHGLFGQIVEVATSSSRVLLITDLGHAVPVQVVRNNLRSIAAGSGSRDSLQLEHLADSADIRQGDVLVSSGLAGRFPAGYPVGTVNGVTRGTGESFARVLAEPSAQLDRSRYLLVLFAAKDEPENLFGGATISEEATP